MNKTTKILVLAAASEPDSGINYDGDYYIYNEKLYYVNLSSEEVTFVKECKNMEDGKYEDQH